MQIKSKAHVTDSAHSVPSNDGIIAHSVLFVNRTVEKSFKKKEAVLFHGFGGVISV